MMEFKFFVCRDSVLLGGKVARALGKRRAKLHISNFADGDLRVWVEEKVEGKNCVVLGTTRVDPNNRLMELCLTVSALKDGGAKSVLAVIPCMGYSRQHKICQRGETNAARLVAQFLEVSGVDKVLFVDLHSDKILDFFRIPAINLRADILFKEKIKEMGLENYVLLAPDFGSSDDVAHLAKKMKRPFLSIKKRRKIKGFGREDWCQTLGISGRVRGRDVVIVDDEISSGGTVVKAAELLKKNRAGKIYVFVTHAVFSGKTYEVLPKAQIEKIFVTDTVPLDGQAFKKVPKLEVISVADLLAKRIKKIFA